MSSMLRRYDAYLFDLDGTLVDTAPDLGRALNISLLEAGFPGVTVDQARQWIGFGARYSITQAVQYHRLRLTEPETDALFERFLSYYEAHVADSSTPYESVIDTLDALHDAGAKLAVVTNKPERFTLPLLAALSLDGYFESVISGDTAPTTQARCRPRTAVPKRAECDCGAGADDRRFQCRCGCGQGSQSRCGLFSQWL